jgi:hypothetical protein
VNEDPTPSPLEYGSPQWRPRSATPIYARVFGWLVLGVFGAIAFFVLITILFVGACVLLGIPISGD